MNLFKKNWNDIAAGKEISVDRITKLASELQKGDVLAKGEIIALDYSGALVKAIGKTFKVSFAPTQAVEVLFVNKGSALTATDRNAIQKEIFKSAMAGNLKKDDSPFAICTASVGRENSEKYEACVLDVKAKLGITKTTATEESLIENASEEAVGSDDVGKGRRNFDYKVTYTTYELGGQMKTNTKVINAADEQQARHYIDIAIGESGNGSGKVIAVELQKSSDDMIKCPNCGGSGEVVFDGDPMACPKCHGNGKIEKDFGLENAGAVPNSLMAKQDLEGAHQATESVEDPREEETPSRQ